MGAVDKQRRKAFAMEGGRMETPQMVGYRAGMSSTGVIGRKLTSVYQVQSDLPDEMQGVVRQLHRTLDRS